MSSIPGGAVVSTNNDLWAGQTYKKADREEKLNADFFKTSRTYEIFRAKLPEKTVKIKFLGVAPHISSKKDSRSKCKEISKPLIARKAEVHISYSSPSKSHKHKPVCEFSAKILQGTPLKAVVTRPT